MKNLNIKNILIAFASLVFLAGFAGFNFSQAKASDETKQTTDVTTGNEVKQEVSEAVEAIKAFSIEHRDAALVKAENLMAELDTRIESWQNQLDENWDQMNQSAREEWQAALKKLRKQRNDLSEWYGSMKYSSAEAWDEIKNGFSEAYTSLQDAFTKAANKFKSEK